jgi:4-amino-4-deoxy-L-arabinose transferase-like glycosyltransferase
MQPQSTRNTQGTFGSVLSARSAVFVFLALIVVGLAAGLRPDAFFAGDPGVKLIAARNALAHPSRPFEIPFPTVNGSPMPFVEPFFARHGDHTHAVTSELYPLLTAPFIALFGLRGAYFLPALGLLLAVASVAGLGRALDPRREAWWTGLVAVLATPFLFYGLEFWEHVPAVALAASGTVLLVHAADRKPDAAGARAFAAGVLFGVATLLRPEAAWFALAVLVAIRWLDPRATWRTLATAVAGGALVAVPFAVYTLLHFGSLTTPHVSTNAGLLGDTTLGARATFARLWFFSGADASIWRATPVIAVALAALLRDPERRGGAFLWVVAAVDTALVLLTAPNDGGAQWGPRYLLFAYVPLAILTADAAPSARLASFGAGRGGRDATKRIVAAVLVTLVLVVGAWSQRAAYRTLRGTKAEYGRLVDALAAAAPAGGSIVTDVWWLDQAAAAVTSRARFLYADNEREAAELMAALKAASASPVIRVTSRTSPRVSTWGDAGCRSQGGLKPLPIPDLVMVHLDCGSSLQRSLRAPWTSVPSTLPIAPNEVAERPDRAAEVAFDAADERHPDDLAGYGPLNATSADGVVQRK